MKPIIIYATDKKITLSTEEFEKYIRDAYDAGHKEGYNEGYAAGKVYGWWQTPTITTPYYNTTTPSTPYDPYKITCSNATIIPKDSFDIGASNIINDTIASLMHGETANAVGDL